MDSNNNRLNMAEDNESLEDLKYLLGNMGIDILLAIGEGAKDFETIKIISGLPLICVKGRIPVLLELNLANTYNDEFYLTEKGLRFKKEINSIIKK
jgi:predicted transcriptional regulator